MLFHKPKEEKSAAVKTNQTEIYNLLGKKSAPHVVTKRHEAASHAYFSVQYPILGVKESTSSLLEIDIFFELEGYLGKYQTFPAESLLINHVWQGSNFVSKGHHSDHSYLFSNEYFLKVVMKHLSRVNCDIIIKITVDVDAEVY